MRQVLGLVVLDISEQEIREDRDLHNSGGHADLMRYEHTPSWFVDKTHEDKKLKPETRISINQTRSPVFNRTVFIGMSTATLLCTASRFIGLS